jgi:cyclopropane fatty-acyl-phospholipid synthase-like methyltransferase
MILNRIIIGNALTIFGNTISLAICTNIFYKKEIDTMVDNKFFFDKSVELGFTTTHYQSLVNLHENGARTLQIMGCKSVFEFGSGLGFFLSACKKIGLYNYIGYDINPFERDFAINKGVDENKYLLSSKQIKGKFDAIYSTEVFEHMTDDELNKILPKLHKMCNKYFYFTSTPFYSENPEFDKEWGHINIKQKEEWIALFFYHGFDFLQNATDVCSWGMIFKKV